MSSCSCWKGEDSSLLCEIYSILTYRCSAGDSLANYAMVVFTTGLQLTMLLKLARNSTPSKLKRNAKFFGIASVLFLWLFQVGLCIAMQDSGDDSCFGISIVWSGQVGIIWYLLYYEPFRSFCRVNYLSELVKGMTVAACALWVYYALTQPLITTVAHAAAVVLGWLLAFFFTCFFWIDRHSIAETQAILAHT